MQKKTTASIERVLPENSVLVLRVDTPIGARHRVLARRGDGNEETLFEAGSDEELSAWLAGEGYERVGADGVVWEKRRPPRKRAPTARQAAALLLLNAIDNAGVDPRQRLRQFTDSRFTDSKICKVVAAMEKLLGGRRRIIEDVVRKYINRNGDRV